MAKTREIKRPCVWICVAVAALASTLAHAGEPDRIGKTDGQITQLGMRLAAIARKLGTTPLKEEFWLQARAVIERSDPVKDATADSAAGHVGFMTYANEFVAERPVASGLRCFLRREAGQRAVFLFGYKEPLAREVGQALLAFDTYAGQYNVTALNSGVLGETSCKSAE